MKNKMIIVLAVMILTAGVNAHAFDTSLIDIRGRFFQESKHIKGLIVTNPTDIIIINNLWSSCLATVNQLDAYFNMLGIFSEVKKSEQNQEQADYLLSWLNEIKAANSLNIKSLNAANPSLAGETQKFAGKLSILFEDLTKRIDKEIEKINIIKKSMQIKK